MGRTSPCESRMPEIQALLDQGRTRKEIASLLGLGRHTVQAFLQRRKIPGIPREKRRLKVDESRLAVLLAEGHTQAHIATTLGVCQSAIERRIRKLDLSTARTGPKAGARHFEWEGGKMFSDDEYVLIYVPLHPSKDSESRVVGYVREHRLVMEVILGRPLTDQEVVHHRDGIRWHNWPDNLQLFSSSAEHLSGGAEDHRRHKAYRRMSGLTGIATSSPLTSEADVRQKIRAAGRFQVVADTLALCPVEIQERLAYYIESFHPTTVHQAAQRQSILGIGAWRDPYRL